MRHSRTVGLFVFYTMSDIRTKPTTPEYEATWERVFKKTPRFMTSEDEELLRPAIEFQAKQLSDHIDAAILSSLT